MPTSIPSSRVQRMAGSSLRSRVFMEETDIRVELGRLKEHKEMIWDDSTDRTVCQWPVTSTKHEGTKVFKTSVD